MLTNATLSRIDLPGAADAGGNVPYTTGAAIDVRCAMDGITSQQRFTLGEAISQATGVMYVEKAAIPAGQQLVKGARVVVTTDGDAAATTFRVQHVRNRQKAGGLSNWECYLSTE